MRTRVLLLVISLAAAINVTLGSCDWMTRDVWSSAYPSVTVANGNVYVVSYEQGKRMRTFGNMVVLKKELRTDKWEGRRIPMPESIRSLGPSKSDLSAFAASITPDDKMVLLFGTQDPFPESSTVLVLSGQGDTGRAIYPPSPYSVFEGAVFANGKIYAVTRPLDEDTGPLYDEGKPVKTLLLEMSMTGDVLRKAEITIHDPIQHDDGNLNGFLPMAVAGTKLFLLENPGVTGEIPARSHVIRGTLQVIDLRKLAVERKIDLAGQNEDVSAYSLFSDGERLYVMAVFLVPFEQLRIFVYDPSSRGLRRIADVPNDKGWKYAPWSFAVMGDTVYLADDFRNLAALRSTGKRFEGIPGLREVGRIEGAPAK